MFLVKPKFGIFLNTMNRSWFNGETDAEKCKLLRQGLERVVDLLDKRLMHQQYMAGDVSSLSENQSPPKWME